MRRAGPPLDGARFVGNLRSLEVHDLDNEDIGPTGCQIDEMVKARNAVPFHDVATARSRGFDACAKCLPGSRR